MQIDIEVKKNVQAPCYGVLTRAPKMKFLKLQQVMDKTTLCRTSIYKLIKVGGFPNNVTVMGKRKAWLESEVEDWMMDKLSKSMTE